METILSRAADRIFGYDFFLSYAHGDGKNYPRLLKERLEQAGFKVFLDQTEYVPGADLRRETRRQVEKSHKLVVVGRHGALQSEWVRREVDIVLARGRTPILVNINRSVDVAPVEARLAAMAREQHWLRLEETIPDADGQPTDFAVSELVRSFGAMRQETKRQRILGAVAAGFAVLSVWAGYLAWLSNERRKEADARLATTLDTATRFVNQTVRMSDRYGVPRAFVLQLLKEPEQVFLELSRTGADTPEVRRRRAQTLLDFSDNYEVLGNSDQRLQMAREAKSILTELVARQPAKTEWQLQLATASSKIGTALLFRGDRAGAEAEYREALRVRKSLADAHPSEPKIVRDYSVALNRMGEVLIGFGRYEEARTYIRQARDIRQAMASASPDDAGLKRDLLVCQIWMGDSLKAERKFAEARAEYVLALEIAQSLFRRDEASKSAARDFTVALNKVGETFLGENDASAARPFYERALPLREKLAADDPGNRASQRDVFVSYIQLGHVAHSQGTLDAARAYFGKALALSEQLHENDRNYAHWQADAAEARGWFGMVAPSGGEAMIRQAIAQLERMRSDGKLAADREGLITDFRRIIERRAAEAGPAAPGEREASGR